MVNSPRWVSRWVQLTRPFVPGRPLQASDFDVVWVDRGYWTW